MQVFADAAKPSACNQAQCDRTRPPERGRPVLLRAGGVPCAGLLSPRSRFRFSWLPDAPAPLVALSPQRPSRAPAASLHSAPSPLPPQSLSMQSRSAGRACCRSWLGSAAGAQDAVSSMPLVQLCAFVRPGERDRVGAGSPGRSPSLAARAMQSSALQPADPTAPDWPGSAGAAPLQASRPTNPGPGPCAGLALAAGLAGTENGSARRTRRLGVPAGCPPAPDPLRHAAGGRGAGGAV